MLLEPHTQECTYALRYLKPHTHLQAACVLMRIATRLDHLEIALHREEYALSGNGRNSGLGISLCHRRLALGVRTCVW